MNDVLDTAPREFSITTGGPFHALARRLHLVGSRGGLRAWRLAAIAWLPLLADSVVRAVAGAKLDPIVFDISVHDRFLIALPLLLLSERLIEQQCRAAILQLSRFAPRADLDRVIDRAERLRDNPWMEAVLAAFALVSGQLVLWGITGPTGVFHGVEIAQLSIPRVWYASLALPLIQFLALRWLWRWVIWAFILSRIARLPLATIASHPDRAAGLAFLGGPITGFAVFEAAFATIMAGAWGTQLLEGRVTVPSLLPTLIAFIIIAFLVACVPILPFCPHLYRAQRAALLLYSPFALDYVRRFHGKWIEHRVDEEVLGTPDIQSLSDLDNAYQAIASTGMFVIGARKLTELWLAAIVPMLPLVITVVPVDQLLRRIASTLFGGLL